MCRRAKVWSHTHGAVSYRYCRHSHNFWSRFTCNCGLFLFTLCSCAWIKGGVFCPSKLHFWDIILRILVCRHSLSVELCTFSLHELSLGVGYYPFFSFALYLLFRWKSRPTRLLRNVSWETAVPFLTGFCLSESTCSLSVFHGFRSFCNCCLLYMLMKDVGVLNWKKTKTWSWKDCFQVKAVSVVAKSRPFQVSLKVRSQDENNPVWCL